MCGNPGFKANFPPKRVYEQYNSNTDFIHLKAGLKKYRLKAHKVEGLPKFRSLPFMGYNQDYVVGALSKIWLARKDAGRQHLPRNMSR